MESDLEGGRGARYEGVVTSVHRKGRTPFREEVRLWPGQKPPSASPEQIAKQQEAKSQPSGGTNTAAPSGKKIVLGWSQRALAGTPWYEAQVKAAQDAARAAGAELIMLDVQNKPEKQVADLEDLVAKKVDAIIMDGVHPMAIMTGVQAANKASIHVIAVDSCFGSTRQTISQMHVRGGARS